VFPSNRQQTTVRKNNPKATRRTNGSKNSVDLRQSNSSLPSTQWYCRSQRYLSSMHSPLLHVNSAEEQTALGVVKSSAVQ